MAPQVTEYIVRETKRSFYKRTRFNKGRKSAVKRGIEILKKEVQLMRKEISVVKTQLQQIDRSGRNSLVRKREIELLKNQLERERNISSDFAELKRKLQERANEVADLKVQLEQERVVRSEMENQNYLQCQEYIKMYDKLVARVEWEMSCDLEHQNVYQDTYNTPQTAPLESDKENVDPFPKTVPDNSPTMSQSETDEIFDTLDHQGPFRKLQNKILPWRFETEQHSDVANPRSKLLSKIPVNIDKVFLPETTLLTDAKFDSCRQVNPKCRMCCKHFPVDLRTGFFFTR